MANPIVHSSKWPDASIPEISLPAYILENAASRGDKAAMIDALTGRTITYRKLVEDIKKFAYVLQQRGFQKGDVLAIYSPNIPEYAVLFLAPIFLGGAVTTMNPLYTVDEIVWQLNHADAKFLFSVPPFLEKALEAKKKTPHLRDVFYIGSNASIPGAHNWYKLLEEVPLSAVSGLVPATVNSKTTIAALPYSSGTTGLPKGVMLSHYNIIANIAQCSDVGEDFSEKDKVIGVLPMFHIYGLVVIMLMGLRQGATVVSLPKFELEPFLKTIQEHKITRGYLVPPIILLLTKHPLVEKYDLSSLKVINSGAAPLGSDLQQTCSQRLKCLVKQGYGLTETSPVTHLFPDDGRAIRSSSVGYLVPNCKCKIVDDNGNAVGINVPGELWIKGPNVMLGYLKNPSATAGTIDNEGYLHTGDIGYVDADGLYYIVDRVKELIKYKGMQVAPAELEALLLANPNIADAAVIGRPDAEAGEVPKAFVVKRNPSITEQDVMNAVNSKVAPHKKIRIVQFVEAIPKSASGKILRRILKDQEKESAAAAQKARL